MMSSIKKTRWIWLSVAAILIIAVMIGALSQKTTAAVYGDWEYTVSDGEVTITKYKGSATSVEIPSEIEGFPVTEIGEKALYLCKEITEVVLPDSLLSIGKEAFSYCSAIKTIKLPKSLQIIDELAFSYCTSITNMVIPNSVSKIGGGALLDCYKIDTLSMPPITTIHSIFSYGSIGGNCAIKSILITGTSPIADNFFYNQYQNTTLEKVVIENGITSIGAYAFYNCCKIKEISIPDSVTSIGNYAFEYCGSLSTINLGKSITKIGHTAFDETAYYKNVQNWKDGALYIGKYLISTDFFYTELMIKEGTTVFADGATSGRVNLRRIIIPKSIKSLGENVFNGCKKLRDIYFGKNVKKILNYAFDGCEMLETVYYGGSNAEWGEIDIKSSGNSALSRANIVYDYNPCNGDEHYFTDWVVFREATEDMEGTMIRLCTVCDYSETREIPKLPSSSSPFASTPESSAPTSSDVSEPESQPSSEPAETSVPTESSQTIVVPDPPESDNLPIIIVAAALGGALLGAGAILLLNLLKKKK